MKKILPIAKALELTAEIPEVQEAILKLENAEFVELGADENGIIIRKVDEVDIIEKDAPSADSVHVDAISEEKKRKQTAMVMGPTAPVIKAYDEELRYTFSPWYVPDSLDAHGEWTDPQEVQQAFWNYLAREDRAIRLQHNMDIVAGEWVEGATWPFEVTVPVKHPDGDLEYTFPAGTPFLGIIWEEWAWELIKGGEIRGLSIGGTSKREDAELEINAEYDPAGSIAFAKMIREEEGLFVVYSEDGSRTFGSYESESEAEERLAEVEQFKHMANG